MIMNAKTMFDNDKGFTPSYGDDLISIKKNGTWVTQNFPIPRGEFRTTVFDVTDWFEGADDYTIKLSFNFGWVLLDYLAVDTSEDHPELITIKKYEPAIATLTAGESDTKFFNGNVTKEGDVLELLTSTDDRFVIQKLGDYIDVGFNNISQKKNKNDIREFVIYSNAYWKNEYAKFAWGVTEDTIDPLPFKAMSSYPYSENESYPYDAKHLNYLSTYNIRKISENANGGHHTMYNDYTNISFQFPPPPLGGKVLTSAGTIIANAIVIILDTLGNLIGTTTSNSTGDWNYITNATIINWTIVGYNPDNMSQGGNAYPFINR
jgi:hypothetical protein